MMSDFELLEEGESEQDLKEVVSELEAPEHSFMYSLGEASENLRENLSDGRLPESTVLGGTVLGGTGSMMLTYSVLPDGLGVAALGVVNGFTGAVLGGTTSVAAVLGADKGLQYAGSGLKALSNTEHGEGAYDVDNVKEAFNDTGTPGNPPFIMTTGGWAEISGQRRVHDTIEYLNQSEEFDVTGWALTENDEHKALNIRTEYLGDREMREFNDRRQGLAEEVADEYDVSPQAVLDVSDDNHFLNPTSPDNCKPAPTTLEYEINVFAENTGYGEEIESILSERPDTVFNPDMERE